MARKPKHEDHENLDRWLVSYADFMTLLFAFFVVMYAISSINEGKYRVLSDALVAAFRNPPQTMQPIQVGEFARSPVNADTSMIESPNAVQLPNFPLLRTRHDPATTIRPADVASAQQAMRRMTDQIRQAMQSLIAKDLIVVRSSVSWVEVEINTSILFPSGSARLSPGAVPILEKLAEILRPFPNAIHVEGFTDDVPINTPAFPSNWELSAARAASVVHLFAGNGVDPKRMAAIGFGEFHPVADNATEAGRSKNRRVVIVVLAQPQDQHLSTLEQTMGGTAAPERTASENPPQEAAAAPVFGPDASSTARQPESNGAAATKPIQTLEPPIRLPAPVALPVKPLPPQREVAP